MTKPESSADDKNDSEAKHPDAVDTGAKDQPQMLGLRPGWNDEGYQFHPDSLRKDSSDNQDLSTPEKILLDLAQTAASQELIPRQDLDMKICVYAGLKFYAKFAMREIARCERGLKALPAYDFQLLDFNVDGYLMQAKNAVASNQLMLDEIAQEFTDTLVEILFGRKSKDMIDGDDDDGNNDSSEMIWGQCHMEVDDLFDRYMYALPSDRFIATMASSRSTIKQFVRDWTGIGEQERLASYSPLLEALERYIPDRRDEKNQPKRVLCPGSGLARLPFEVLSRGYAAQGNEYAHVMLICSDWILNHLIPRESLEIFPYVLQNSNRNRRSDAFQSARLPDCSPGQVFSSIIEKYFSDIDLEKDGPVFSMTEGEFVEAYDAEINKWDCVLTSFFIDTATNIIQYIKTIARAVKPGGYFISNGPLLYHYAESDSKLSIELSYEDVISVTKRWFDIVEEQEYEANYTANGRSLMRTHYTTKFFVARRTAAADPPPVVANSPFQLISDD